MCRSPSSIKGTEAFEKFSRQVKSGQKLQYDVTCSWFTEADGIWPCCSLYQVSKWNIQHIDCDQSIWPYQSHQLELNLEYCDECYKHSHSIIAYYHHHDLTHFGLKCWICALCREPYVSKQMLYFHVTSAHRGPMSFKKEVAQRCIAHNK